jgi:hypothetical protein
LSVYFPGNIILPPKKCFKERGEHDSRVFAIVRMSSRPRQNCVRERQRKRKSERQRQRERERERAREGEQIGRPTRVQRIHVDWLWATVGHKKFQFSTKCRKKTECWKIAT